MTVDDKLLFMTPHQKCLQTLRVLIREGDSNGVPLAEKAVNELAASFPDANARTGALHVLQEELTPTVPGERDASTEMTANILDYCDKLIRELREGE